MANNVWLAQPSGFSKTMGYLSGLMILGVVWIPIGHIFLGSSGGWMVFLGFLFFMPIYLVVCAAHALMMRAYSRRVGVWAAGPWGSVMTLVFLAVVALYPIAVADYGDAPDSYAPSKIQTLMDLDKAAASSVQTAATSALLTAGVLLIVADIVDLISLSKRLREPESNGPFYFS